MLHILSPTTLPNTIRIGIDASLESTIQHLTGWQLITSGSAPHSIVCTAPSKEEEPSTQEAAFLHGNEYVACIDKDIARLYVRDGQVHLTGDHEHIYVTGYPDSNGYRSLPGSMAVETALFYALLRQRILLVHALAFRYEETGVLVLGSSGAGKTTLAMAVLASGGQIVSDDRIALRLAGDGAFSAYNMRPHLQIREHTLKQAAWQTVAGLSSARPLNNYGATLECKALGRAHLDRITIDHVLALTPVEKGRPQGSQLSPAGQADTLAALIAASLPLAFALPEQLLGVKPGSLCLDLIGPRAIHKLTTGTRLLTDAGSEIQAIVSRLSVASH